MCVYTSSKAVEHARTRGGRGAYPSRKKKNYIERTRARAIEFKGEYRIYGIYTGCATATPGDPKTRTFTEPPLYILYTAQTTKTALYRAKLTS